MKYLFVILSLAVGFVSCQKNEEEKTVIKNEIEKSTHTSENEVSIIDPDFIDHLFEFGTADLQILKRKFKNNIEIKRQPIENIHVKGQIDTLYTVNIKNSQFIIYKIPTDQFLESAEINDSLIKLNRDISVGISKNNFKEKFSQLKNLSNISDTITVQGEDAEGNMVFTFKNNVLNKIEFFGYID